MTVDENRTQKSRPGQVQFIFCENEAFFICLLYIQMRKRRKDIPQGQDQIIGIVSRLLHLITTIKILMKGRLNKIPYKAHLV